MGINVRAFRRIPQSPVTSSALRMSNQTITMPQHSPQALAQPQAFSSLAANFPNRGLTNPVLLNGFGTNGPSAIDPTNTDSGVYIPMPYCPVVQISLGNGNPGATFTLRWRGINHMGEPVYFTESKSNTSGAGTFYFQSQCAFSYVDSCEVLAWGGLAADMILIGIQYDFTQTGSAGPVKRIPLPFAISQPSDFIGVSFLEIGGATWSTTAWAVGDSILRWSTGSGLDLSSYPTSPQFNTGLIAIGRATTPPSTPWNLSVMCIPESRIYPGRALPNNIVI